MQPIAARIRNGIPVTMVACYALKEGFAEQTLMLRCNTRAYRLKRSSVAFVDCGSIAFGFGTSRPFAMYSCAFAACCFVGVVECAPIHRILKHLAEATALDSD